MVRSTIRRAKRAFTLVELLVVIAISAILLGLLMYPLYYAQQIANRVQSQATAQDAARNGVERISRELAQATFVFDNTATPVIIPLNRTINYNGAPTTNPPILFAKLDYILPDSTSGNPNDPLDPTTGKPMSGTNVTFPLAPGTRVVRHFLGLANNTRPYGNRYEFRGEDTDFNPVLLYRVEFDPSDPNLVAPNTPPLAAGGFNDPNFFYNTNVAPNGATYAANWKRKASAVISGPRLDMLAWRRDGSRELIPDLPIQTLAYFAPAAVSGDTGTPSSMTAGNAETPGAPPTLYSSQHAQWTLPFTVSFYRSTTTPGNEGAVQFVFEMDNTTGRLRVRSDMGSGTLQIANAGDIYTSLSAVTGKVFVKTPRLTFMVDPLRGRIETGFPPLAGSVAGVPLLDEYNQVTGMSANNRRPFVASLYPTDNYGELVPTVLSVTTLDPRAGATTRTDQGLWGIDLFNTTATRYVSLNYPIPAQYSPLRIFGNTDGTGAVVNAGGIMIAPGTEQVLGPEIPLGNSPQLLPYSRVNALSGAVALRKESPVRAGAVPATAPYSPVTGQRTYALEQFLKPNKAELRFDSGEGVIDPAYPGLLLAPDILTPGLPAVPSGQPQRFLRVSYLWQNNFARDVQGRALNASDELSTGNDDFKPEGDVVKVDYSTRSLMNVQIGARVHDSNAPVPQTIQFADKVRVGNAVR